MDQALSTEMRRHLTELVDAPYWHPVTSGEWSVARALARRGLVRHSPGRGSQPYELTEQGATVALSLRNA
jgi:hypothetical protein